MFNRYYVTYPTCCPSRTTLLSGRYAHSHGVISNGAPRGGWPGFKKRPSTTTTSRSGCGAPATGPTTTASSSTSTESSGSRGGGPARLDGLGERRHRPLDAPVLRLHAERQRPAPGALREPRIRPGGKPGPHRLRPGGGPGHRLQLPDGHHDPAGARPDRRLDARRPLLPPARLHRPARRPSPADRARACAPPLRQRDQHAAAEASRGSSTRATSPTSRASSATRPTTWTRRRSGASSASTRRRSSRCGPSMTGSG